MQSDQKEMEDDVIVVLSSKTAEKSKSSIFPMQLNPKILKEKIDEYLHDSRIINRSDNEATHITTFPPGSYILPATEQDNFYEIYSDYLFCKDSSMPSYNIGEMSKSEIQLILDIDFVSNNTDDNIPVYTSNDYEEIINSTFEVLKEKTNIKPSIEHSAFLLEKKYSKEKNGGRKHGIHIHFPLVIMKIDDINNVIYPAINAKLQNLATRFGLKDIIDGKCNKPWMLYGCHKKDENESYKLTRIYNFELNIIGLEEYLSSIKLKSFSSSTIEYTKNPEWYLPILLSNRNKFNYKTLTILSKAENILNNKKTMKSKTSISKTDDSFSIEERLIITDKYVKMLSPERASYHDPSMFVGFAIHNYTCGTKEGFDIFNRFSKTTTRNNYNYKTVVNFWNGIVPKKEGGLSIGTIKLYAQQDSPKEYKKKTINSFQEVIEKARLDTHYDYAKALQIYTPPNSLYSLGDTFVCADIKNNIWYEFDGVLWKKSDSCIGLRTKIETVLYPVINKLSNKLQKDAYNFEKNYKSDDDDYKDSDDSDYSDDNKSRKNKKQNKNDEGNEGDEGNEDDEGDEGDESEEVDIEDIEPVLAAKTYKSTQKEREEKEKRRKKRREKKKEEKKKKARKTVEDKYFKALRALSELKRTTFKNSIMKECQEVFYRANFEEKLDQDTYLVGFANGVLDLRELKFRESTPSDYISISTGYDYTEYDENNEQLKELDTIIRKIFVDEELYDYFIYYIGTLLRGTNFNKTVSIWTGIGNNGKSVIIKLLEYALGSYQAKLPTSILFNKRSNSSGATPELSRTIGKRFITLQEPGEKDDNINTGVLKELSGMDSFYARGLYKEGFEVKPQFKLVLMCNKLPDIDSVDPAVWNRIRVVPFESVFALDEDQVPKTEEEQWNKKKFLADKTIMDEKVHYLKGPLMYRMFQSYIKDIQDSKENKKRKEPYKVMEATEKYRQENDIYRNFINDILEPNDSSYISQCKLIEEVLDYCKRNNPGKSQPTKNDIVKNFNRLIGEPSGSKGYKGFRMKGNNTENVENQEFNDRAFNNEDDDE